MDNFTYVYSFPFRCMMRDGLLVINKEILDNNNHGFLINPKIHIIVIDSTLSIRDFLKKNRVNEMFSPIVKLCRFYVCAYEKLTEQQASSVSNEIVRMSHTADYKDRWLNFNKISITNKYSIKLTYSNISDAIDLVPRIYLHFGHYVDHKDKYIFINSTSIDGSLNSNDECIEYINFDKRNKYPGILHAKVNSDNSVDTFDYFPLTENIPKVFLLKEGWDIPTNRNNKIAIRIYNHMVFWLLTVYHTFITHQGYSHVEKITPSCSSLDMGKLSMDQINFICTIFKEVGGFGFGDIQFGKQCIYSVDESNNLFMFIGIIQEDLMGNFASLLNAYE